MTFFTAPLFDYCPVRFSDIGLLLLLFYVVLGKKDLMIPRCSKWAFLFIVWIVFDFLLLSGDKDFLAVNYIFSAIRIFFGMLIITLLPVSGIIEKIDMKKLGLALKRVVMFHVYLVLVYAFLFYVFKIESLFNIVSPYEKSQIIKENYLLKTHFRTIIVEKERYRMCGLFEEPAWFGWVINLLIGIVFQIETSYKKIVLKKKEHILLFIAYLLVKSLSAIAGLVIIYMVRYFFQRKITLAVAFKTIFAAMAGVGVFAVVFWTRLGNIVSLNDASSLFRVIGSFNLAFNTMKNNPLTGYGLGDMNRNIVIAKYLNNNPVGIKLPGYDLVLDLHNMLLSVLCTLGFVGFIIFLNLYKPLFRAKQYIILVSFFIVFFTLNVFTTYFFYTAIGLSYIIAFKARRT
ncbi:MAG: O-antigen ligase family protein [Bacteroidales bacterium]|jgi:hypothetical protein|nr:O-antigen ligase family protein [Bacteroidales bacterium]